MFPYAHLLLSLLVNLVRSTAKLLNLAPEKDRFLSTLTMPYYSNSAIIW